MIDWQENDCKIWIEKRPRALQASAVCGIDHFIVRPRLHALHRGETHDRVASHDKRMQRGTLSTKGHAATTKSTSSNSSKLVGGGAVAQQQCRDRATPFPGWRDGERSGSLLAAATKTAAL